MGVLFVLIPLSVVLIAIAAAALLWAIRSGQYDDLDRQDRRMPDDEP